VSAQPDDELLGQLFWSGQIPWRRTNDEVLAECAKLTQKTDDLVARDPDPYDELDRMLAGIAAAAWWTTGKVAEGPMSRQAAALDGASLGQEIRLAQAVGADRQDPNAAYAMGVSAWMGWLVGVLDRVLYPDEI